MAKKQLSVRKVYMVIETDVCDGCEECKATACETLKIAKQVLADKVKQFKAETPQFSEDGTIIDEDKYVCEESEDDFSFYEDGYFPENHHTISIHEDCEHISRKPFYTEKDMRDHEQNLLWTVASILDNLYIVGDAREQAMDEFRDYLKNGDLEE